MISNPKVDSDCSCTVRGGQRLTGVQVLGGLHATSSNIKVTAGSGCFIALDNSVFDDVFVGRPGSDWRRQNMKGSWL